MSWSSTDKHMLQYAHVAEQQFMECQGQATLQILIPHTEELILIKL